MKIFLIILVVLVVLLVGALLYGAMRWRKQTTKVRAQIRAAHKPSSILTYDAREIESLPAPVHRFFQQVITDGQPLIRAAQIGTSGQFLMGGIKGNWKPFTADQFFHVQRPGFDWDARIQMAPGLTAFVRDAYVIGSGLLHAEALGLITVANEQNTPELAQGELLRHLAEMLWFPTALLPSQGVQWKEIDQDRALATITDGATTVSMEFRFGADGLINAAYTPARFRTINGVSEACPWYARYGHYERHENMLLPMQSEIEWQMPNDTLPYWRGNITNVNYEYVNKN